MSYLYHSVKLKGERPREMCMLPADTVRCLLVPVLREAEEWERRDRQAVLEMLVDMNADMVRVMPSMFADVGWVISPYTVSGKQFNVLNNKD